MTLLIPEIAVKAKLGDYIRFSGFQHTTTKCEDIAERVANTQMKKNINKFFVYSSLFVFQGGRRQRRPLFEIHYQIFAFYGLYIYKYVLRACNNNNLSQIPAIVKCITMVFLRAIKNQENIFHYFYSSKSGEVKLKGEISKCLYEDAHPRVEPTYMAPRPPEPGQPVYGPAARGEGGAQLPTGWSSAVDPKVGRRTT